MAQNLTFDYVNHIAKNGRISQGTLGAYFQAFEQGEAAAAIEESIMRIRVVGMGGVVLAFLIFASVTLAGKPTGRVYGAPGADVDKGIADQQQRAGDVVTGTLPFTGLDLALLTLGAAFLLLLGWGLRRLRAQS